MRLLLASTSTVHGSGYLEYIRDFVGTFFGSAERVLFIPFARPSGISHEDYTAKAADVFGTLGKEVRGAHSFSSVTEALEWADGFFTGGGNTFVLLRELYTGGWKKGIQEAVQNGKPYMGTSAGSNIAGKTICTTNDMPIVYPPSFDALGFIPFNLNPHYLDPIAGSTHMGETRATRIHEFHQFNEQPVVGLREGSALHLQDNDLKLWGTLSARLFEANQEAREVEPGSSLNFLMHD